MSSIVEAASSDEEVRKLAQALRRRAPSDAFVLLHGRPDAVAAAALAELDLHSRRALLERYPEAQRAVLRALEPRLAQLAEASDYEADAVGRLMMPVSAVFPLGISVSQMIERIRALAARERITYAYVVNAAGALQGVVTMRDLLIAEPSAPIEDVMLRQPFVLDPQMSVEDAMHETARRHYPQYPVCDADGKLLGTVIGAELFEARAYAISAQGERMFGVDGEERLRTPWTRSLKLRNPWLFVNLLAALLVGFIVSLFGATLEKAVLLAAFLPVLSSVAGNTGCQALAVTLRGLALGEYEPGMSGSVLRKELLLGTLNGALIGLAGAAVMYAYALFQHSAQPLAMALTVLAASTFACLAGGFAGVAVPWLLRRAGADPATASSIFLTTTTDIVGMSVFLGMAAALLT
jgi:magnesium transporter